MSAIERCRTAALGGHVERCEKCSHTLIAYNSCRNRHCPKCQGAAERPCVYCSQGCHGRRIRRRWANRPNFLLWSLNGIVPFEWSFFGQNILQLKVVKDACRNSTNEISYSGSSPGQSQRSWLLIVVEMGIVRANCCNRSASPCIERPDRKFAPRQRPPGDRIGGHRLSQPTRPVMAPLAFRLPPARRPSGMELASQMPHRSAIARRRSSVFLLAERPCVYCSQGCHGRRIRRSKLRTGSKVAVEQSFAPFVPPSLPSTRPI
jgi:hypothetical protein